LGATQPSSTPRPPNGPWLQALYIAGSIASVTGLSLLALNRVLSTIQVGEIVAWAVAASLLLAALGLIVMLLQSGAATVVSRFGRSGLTIYWLVTVPVAVILGIVLFQYGKGLVVPFVLLIIYGRYPLE
jgi:SNF family Na+-dependent transporter